ncbi:S24 family peptidase [Tatumella sp. JGM118]|uniref:XRE family transcriptional regulator n=1 Tax=Tatumella sp. JGM118 TaxID=2799796 RepID=UPI001BB0ADFF|nr:S24 family peptidase [Tatumella sp. JGM118]MBS0909178.1 helix-turn-helix transcriptional regulator [Tatumella sp. JGM118]
MKIGTRIRQLRKAKKMTILELATSVGSDVGNISRLETGKQGYTESTLIKIAEALGVKVADLFSDDMPTDIEPVNRPISSHRVDVLDIQASAGPGTYLTHDFVEKVRAIEYTSEEAKALFSGRSLDSVKVISANGDSMSGTIEAGDLLFVDVSIKMFEGDGIYTFLYDDTAHVKRLQKMKDKLLVISDNKNYTPWDPIERDEMNRVVIFGKVIGSMPQTYRKHG